MNKKQLIELVGIIGVNSLSIFCVLVLEWSIFEIAYLYIMQAGVVFALSYIHQYFINKKTREPFLIALLGAISVLGTLIFIILFMAVLIYSIVGPDYDKIQNMFADATYAIGNFNYYGVLIPVILFDTIIFIILKIASPLKEQETIWKNMLKIFYLHAFIGIAAVVYGFFHHTTTTGAIIFIIAKTMVDFFVEVKEVKISIKNFFPKK